MEIVEQFIQSKTGRIETCEDGIFASDHFVVIVDGSTSKTDKRWNGKTPGQIAKDCILAALPYIDPNTSAKKFMIACNEAINNWYTRNKILIEMKEHINQRCTASIIAYSAKKRQIWTLGSGNILLDGQYISETLLIDNLFSELRSYYIQTELKRGVSEYELREHDTSRDVILPILVKQLLFQNSDQPSEFNYSAIDGFFTNENSIRITNVPESIEQLVLTSDGYPETFSTLEKTEHYLKSVLKDDPLLYKKYKSTKGLQRGNVSFDDRSYIRIKV